MKNITLNIALTYKNSCLHEISTADFSSDIYIGRSSKATWKTPAEETSVSSRHAVIRNVNGSFILEDLDSHNGTFCGGRSIKSIKLKPGVVVSIGQCKVAVTSSSAAASVTRVEHHSLEYISGPSKGTTVPLTGDIFSIGSSRENNFVISEPLISQRHCEIRTDELGNCWLMDLGSANGTKVNKQVLTEGKERMLKDGDIISLVHVDLRFLDKNVIHTRSYLRIKVIAAAVTLFIVAAIYFSFVNAAPNAYDIIRKSREIATSGAFVQAREHLQQAVNAREFEKFQSEYRHLQEQIALWETTVSEWNSALGSIEQKRWTNAVRSLSMIKFDNMESWGWNEENALESKKVALNLRNCLEIYLLALGKFESEHTQIDELRTLKTSLQTALTERNTKLDSSASKLFEAMKHLTAEIDCCIKSYSQLNAILLKLNTTTPNFKIILREMEAVEENSIGFVKMLAKKYLIPVRKLEKCQKALLDNVCCLANLNFSGLVLKFDLPTMDEAAVNPHISLQRQNILIIHKNFLAALMQIKHFHALQKQWKVAPPASHPLITVFFDDNVMQKIMECDVLQQQLPFRNRKSASSVYDDMLGVEYFYDFLKTLPRQYDNSALEFMKFTPKCVMLKRLLEQYDSFIAFMNLPENRWLVRGKLAALLQYCVRQVQMRDAFIEKCKAVPADISRTSILKRGLAVYFSREEKISAVFLMKLVQDLKKNCQELNSLATRYDKALPREAMTVRELIMQKGIPGDSTVRRVWATK